MLMSNMYLTKGLIMLYMNNLTHKTRNASKRECLRLIPHEKFSFAKIWLLAAHVGILQLNLKGARQIWGNAIVKAPKDKIFKKYIETKLQLENIDRRRKLYEKHLEWYQRIATRGSSMLS